MVIRREPTDLLWHYKRPTCPTVREPGIHSKSVTQADHKWIATFVELTTFHLLADCAETKPKPLAFECFTEPHATFPGDAVRSHFALTRISLPPWVAIA